MNLPGFSDASTCEKDWGQQAMTGRAEDLWRLLYRSTCCIDGFSMTSDMTKLLTVSARNNLRDRITGLLVYHDGLFVQVLEGPRDKVLSCYDRITSDNRHRDLEVLIDEGVNRRLFPRWDLGFMDALETPEFPALLDSLHSKEADALGAMKRLGREYGLIQQVRG